MYAIDDPRLMAKLSEKQTKYVSIDALNHVVEAATSKVASPYTICLAHEVISMVAKYLPKALANPEDLEARYYLAYAAMMGGVCFDNGLLHYTHALEHPLSAVKHELSHGLGLAILLPAVVENMWEAKKETLAHILKPIAPEISTITTAKEANTFVYDWLKSVGVPNKLKDEGFYRFVDKESIYMISPAMIKSEMKFLEGLDFATHSYKKKQLEDEKFVQETPEAQLAIHIFGKDKNIGTASIGFDTINSAEWQEKKKRTKKELEEKGASISDKSNITK